MEDIKTFPMIVRKLIEAKGCVVRDEFLCTGKRARRSDGKGDLKHKSRKSQRKATMVSPRFTQIARGHMMKF